LLGSLASWRAACAAPADEPSARVDEEVIVQGRSYRELRLAVQLAQDAVFARFNEINSDDKFDIHCRLQPRYGSRIMERACLSNSWREQDANFAQATVQQIRGELTTPPTAFRGEQLLMQQRLGAEMRRLALEDAQLREAVQELGRAMLAMNEKAGTRPMWTLSRDVPEGTEGLPFDAERVIEVRMGDAAWNHPLTQSTFTLGQVDGAIRKIEIECADDSLTLDYEPDVEWTIPRGLTDCQLRIRAKTGTTFALYEFE
jgi:hypothetical protein